MPISHFFLLTALLVGANSAGWAQLKSSFSLRAGYQRSSTLVDRSTTVLVGLTPIQPKAGYYAGLALQQPLATHFTTQVEINYQQKGLSFYSTQDQQLIKNTYHYLGVTATVGVRLIKSLSLLVGPEVNWRFNHTADAFAQSFEIGLAGRALYQFNRVGLTGGYFRGLVPYEKGLFPLTNQNWQVGLSYQLTKIAING